MRLVLATWIPLHLPLAPFVDVRPLLSLMTRPAAVIFLLDRLLHHHLLLPHRLTLPPRIPCVHLSLPLELPVLLKLLLLTLGVPMLLLPSGLLKSLPLLALNVPRSHLLLLSGSVVAVPLWLSVRVAAALLLDVATTAPLLA
jgi:hypothetical protein